MLVRTEEVVYVLCETLVVVSGQGVLVTLVPVTNSVKLDVSGQGVEVVYTDLTVVVVVTGSVQLGK